MDKAKKKPATKSTPAEPKKKEPPLRYKATQKLIAKLEAHLGGPLLCYWNSDDGEIGESDVNAMYEMMKKIGKVETLYLFIKSGGGSGESSLRLVQTLRQFAKRVVSLVPLECASAATMLALGTDEVRMGPLAWLSAVDTSLTHDLSPIDRDNYRVSVSLDELKRVVRLHNQESDASDSNPYAALFKHVHPLVIGAVDRADSLSTLLCVEILSFHIKDKKKCRAIAKALNENYPSHTYPILKGHAREIGINANEMDEETNEMLISLGDLYSEMTQECKTDYSPSRYHNIAINTIHECRGKMIFNKFDKEWNYRESERRWVSMHDEGGWFRQTGTKKENGPTRFFIS